MTRSRISCLDRGTHQRYRDHRADAQARLGWTDITNDEFVTLLLDVFALHCEREGLEPRPGEEAREKRLVADGGFETATTEYSRRVTTRDEIQTLADDIRVGTHNMWVDVRSPDDYGGYEPVTVDVTVEVVGGKPDREPLTDGGTVTVENPELFDRTVRKLKGIADDLERVDDLNLTASTIHDCARDLEAATRREVDDER